MKVTIPVYHIIGHDKRSRYTLTILWWYMLCVPVMCQWLRLPDSIKYIGDMLIIWLALVIVSDIFRTNLKSKLTLMSKIFIVLFFAFGIMSSLMNFNSVISILWGIRNQGRFFIFFIGCSMYIKKDDLKDFTKVLSILFWISLPICFYQAYFVSYPAGTIIGDMVGGIFGSFSGCVMPLNILLILNMAQKSVDYFYKRCSLFSYAIVIIAGMYMGVLSELKVIIPELLLIVLFSMIYTKMSWKKIVVALFAVGLLSVAASVFVAVNARGRGYYTEDYLSISGMIENLTRSEGYNGQGDDLNRLTGVINLYNTIFQKDNFQFLFGLGIGGGEFTNFFSTTFYKRYYMLHYQWFHFIWMYIENGILGIVCFWGFIIEQLKRSLKFDGNNAMNIMVKICICMMPILYVYNTSLRSETMGFYLYLTLAIPTILLNETKNAEYLC